MPTGYTADVIEKDISFREFALKCMRAFGALVSFRDDDFDKVITEVPLSSYHKMALANAKEELSRFNAQSDAEHVRLAKEAIRSAAKSSSESLASATKDNAKLTRMAGKVNRWKPPTPEHEHYKEFMLDQLKISLHDLKYYEVKKIDLSNSAIALWIAQRRASLQRDIKYHEEHYAEDIRKNAEANAWIKVIVDSLPQENKA